MIKHIVMWTIRSGETSGSKPERMAEVKTRILGLKGKIKEIVSMEVNYNSPSASDDNYDVIMISEFRSWEELEVYQNHPDHQEVVEYIRNVRQNRAAIDYEF